MEFKRDKFEMNDLSESLNFSVRDTMSGATHGHIMHSVSKFLII